MKAAKAALLAVALIVLAGVFVWNYQQRNDPAYLIEKAAAGSATAIERLESLAAAGELEQYSDAIGKAAVEIAQGNSTIFDREDPVVLQWQQLFFSTDPLVNASESTRRAYAAAHTRVTIVGPESIQPGIESTIGIETCSALRRELTPGRSPLRIMTMMDNYWVEDRDIFQGGVSSTETDIMPRGSRGSGGATFQKVLVPTGHDAAPGDVLTLRTAVTVRLTDYSTNPPSVFAEWTVDLSKAASINPAQVEYP